VTRPHIERKKHSEGRHRRLSQPIAAVMAVAAVSGSISGFSTAANAASVSHAAKGPWTIALSNSLYGNSWREEMICSVQQEAVTPAYRPYVKKVLVANAGSSVTTQVAEIRNFITDGVNAIIIDPASTVGYNQVIQEAMSRGIKVVVTDQFINDPAPWQVENNQYQYGVIGMTWLAHQLHGHGDIAVIRGIIGAPADTARENGVQSVLRKYPSIHVVAQAAGGWDAATAHTALSAILAAHPSLSGVWVSGGSVGAVQAVVNSHRFIPMVGEDGIGYLQAMLKYRSKGFVAALVTNPPPIGAMGLKEAVGLLRGQTFPKKSYITPHVYPNDTATGLSYIRSHITSALPVTASSSWSIPGQTGYSLAAMARCLG